MGGMRLQKAGHASMHRGCVRGGTSTRAMMAAMALNFDILAIALNNLLRTGRHGLEMRQTLSIRNRQHHQNGEQP